MKRKITIEEFDDSPAQARRSRFDQIIDYLCGAPLERGFYPPALKHAYFPNGKTYKTVAFTNGVLFGGCLMQHCVNSCVPIEQFCPTDNTLAAQFKAHLQVHDAAVSNGDVGMATQYRLMVEGCRSDICVDCKSRANGEPAESAVTEELSASQDMQDHADSDPMEPSTPDGERSNATAQPTDTAAQSPPARTPLPRPAKR